MRLTTTLIAATALTAAFAAGRADARPMEIEDLASIQHAYGLAISPDGETLAYGVSVPRDVLSGEEDGTPRRRLYVLGQDGEPRQFLETEKGLGGIAFGPQGERLLFRSRRGDDEHTALYAISLAGGEARKVFAHDTSIGDFAMSPDGETLYFAAAEDGEETAEKLSEKGFKAHAYEENLDFTHLWRVDLTQPDAEAEAIFTEGDVSSIELSSDGETLVAAVAPTPLVDDYYMKRRFHVLDASDGSVDAVIETPGKIGGFDISPDGSTLAFHAGTDINDTSTGVLMVADLDTGEFEQLTPDAEQHVMEVDWVGDDAILTTVHRGVESELMVYDTAGQAAGALAVPNDLVVRGVAVRPDTELAFIADSAAHPRAVFRHGGDSSVEKVSNHNGWLDEIDIMPQRAYRYTARDGVEVEGVLITPEGRPPRGGWPLILPVHGGPEAHDSDGWLTRYSDPGQIGAGRGYAVFYPNYRGSTGRGVAYAKAHQDDYAGKEFNDLVDAVNALAEEGIIDADRAGITGGSYGGYASMWGATALSEHFAASVAFVGISNQLSKFGTTDIPNEMYHVHSRRWPWEDNWMNLLKRSPIYHVGEATTPTLILHGEEDTRVHPSQSMELYRSMKVRTDTPVRLVFYPGEGHGNRKAAAQADYAMRMMRWMDQYLARGAKRDAEKPDFDLGLMERFDEDKADSEE